MDCSLPGSYVHRILQARRLEWVAIYFSRGSSWQVSNPHFLHCRNFLQLQADSLLSEPPGKPWETCICPLSLQFSSVILSCQTPCNPMDCSMPGLPVHHQLLESTQTHVHRVGDAIQPSHSLSSPSPTFNLSQHQGLFQWVSSSHQVPKYWSCIFNINPSNEYSGLISFRMNWLDLLAVQETLKNLLQHHSSKASILWCSAFFIVQLSHPYMTTGKTIALTRWTFVGKVMSLLCNMLSRLVITFLPRSNCLLISWLQSPSAVILEPRKIKFPHLFPMKLWDWMSWS